MTRAPYTRPLPAADERRALDLALALAAAPLDRALAYLHNAGTAPAPETGRRLYAPAVHRAGWLLLRWHELRDRTGQAVTL
jgi:hypothetical protein